MLAWIASLVRGVSLTGWLLGGAAAAALAYLAGSQLVLHNRQAALDAALADKAVLSSQLDQVRALNASNLRVLAEMQADHQRDLADLEARARRAEDAARQLADLKVRNAQDVDAAAPLADRCAALDRLFDRLHEGGAAAPGGGQGRARGGETPRAPARLP